MLNDLEKRIILFIVDYAEARDDWFINVRPALFSVISNIITSQDEWQIPVPGNRHRFYGICWRAEANLAGVPIEIGGVKYDNDLKCNKIGFGYYSNIGSYVQKFRNFWVFSELFPI
jgi:hypothetical protein